MTETRDILMAHARRYPQMACTDAVKLLFQNEFGGGHMIADEKACLAFLRREYEATAQQPDAALTEDIGNGTVRVMLCALDAHGFAPEALGQAFLRSASVSGSPERFQQKLALLRRLTEEGIFAFPPGELEAYLYDYAAAGYPPVSHSPRYRQLYAPAYRVLRREFLPHQFQE